MEWVAYLAGEAHSDNPASVSPALAAFARSRNDALDDHARQRLRPYLARSIGTAGDGGDEWRARLCTDWLVRTCAAALLEHAGLSDAAAGLRRVDATASDLEAAAHAAATARARRRGAAVTVPGAIDGARHAARALSRAAGWEAARAAVRATELSTDRADVACRVARDAAWAAAWRDAPAPWLTAQPLADELRQSSFGLLERMLGAGHGMTVESQPASTFAEPAETVAEAHRGRGGSAHSARTRPAGPRPCASARRSARRSATVGSRGVAP
jgi:hypothetical protein